MSDIDTFCAQCGPNVDVDDDGCCVTCGATAIGSGVEYIDRLRARNAELEAENDRLKAFIADKIHDATIERMMVEVHND